MIHSFLLIGQSNMAGRGFRSEVEDIKNPNLRVLRNGRWQKMFFPVNPDRDFSGVCLAESFADAYSKDHEGVEVGLIPCADGGTCLDQWAEGSLLFDNAVYQSILAKRTSKIVGVLWHQGEGDTGGDNPLYYEEKFTKIMNALREKLDLPDVPFILGGLGDYLPNFYGDKRHERVNEQLVRIANNNDAVGFASAEGLTPNPDNIHFNARSLREFGLRYYEEYKKFDYNAKLNEGDIFIDDSKRSALELL